MAPDPIDIFGHILINQPARGLKFSERATRPFHSLWHDTVINVFLHFCKLYCSAGNLNFLVFSEVTMPRGPKKHLKRLAAPKAWMLAKLGGAFTIKSSSGPHKQSASLPITLFIR